MTTVVKSGMNSQARAANGARGRGREAATRPTAKASSTCQHQQPRRQRRDHDAGQEADELDPGIEALQKSGPAGELVGGDGVLDPGRQRDDQVLREQAAAVPTGKRRAGGAACEGD